MADQIRPRDLPPVTDGIVNSAAAIIVDGGTAVQKSTPLQLVDAAVPLASQADAEAGTDNSKRMSPLRVYQSIIGNFAKQTFRRALANGDPVSTAVDVPAYIWRSQRRQMIDFIDKSFWAGMRSSTPPSVAPTNSDGQDSFLAAMADMAGYPDRRLDLPNAWINQSAAWNLNDQYYAIMGAGSENTILRTLSATADQIVMGSPFCRVEGIQFASSVARTAGAAVHVLYTADKAEVSDIWSYGAFSLVKLDGHPTNPAADHGIFTFSKMRAYETPASGTALDIGGGYFVGMDDVIVTAPGPRCQFALRVRRCADAAFNRMQLLNSGYALYAVPATGDTIASFKMRDSYCGTSSNGSIMSVVAGGSIVSAGLHDCWLSEADATGGRGFSAIGSADGRFAGLQMTSCQSFLNAGDGYYFDRVKGLQATGMAADGNPNGSGAAITNCTNAIVEGRFGAERFGGNQYGIFESGNTALNLSGNCRGNSLANFSNGSGTAGHNFTGLISA